MKIGMQAYRFATSTPLAILLSDPRRYARNLSLKVRSPLRPARASAMQRDCFVNQTMAPKGRNA
jgi:hypothetical protein